MLQWQVLRTDEEEKKEMAFVYRSFRIEQTVRLAANRLITSYNVIPPSIKNSEPVMNVAASSHK